MVSSKSFGITGTLKKNSKHIKNTLLGIYYNQIFNYPSCASTFVITCRTHCNIVDIVRVSTSP